MQKCTSLSDASWAWRVGGPALRRARRRPRRERATRGQREDGGAQRDLVVILHLENDLFRIDRDILGDDLRDLGTDLRHRDLVQPCAVVRQHHLQPADGRFTHGAATKARRSAGVARRRRRCVARARRRHHHH